MDSKTETVSDNAMIAEFMGYTRYGPHGLGRFDIGNGYPSHTLSALQFDTSWDWLMPVVEKIESPDLVNGYSFSVEILKQHEDNQIVIYSIIRDAAFPMVNFQARGNVKLKALYKAVVEFIRWYNNSQSPGHN